jgi:hypothetical protein
MNKQVNKFLEFNGKTLVFLAVDGQYWIALKPICEALRVEYTRTFKNAKTDPIFGPVLAIQPIQIPGDQTRNMVCLPENWVYGWLLSIQSASPELLEYKKECYQVLYNHFHGSITGRKELLSAKAKAQVEVDEVMNSLTPDNALKFEKAQKRINQVNARLRELDGETLEEERNLFNTKIV